jgi:hypothetical protein
MRLVHSHDPVPEDPRPLSVEEIGAAIARAHEDMWAWAAKAEFQLAHVCEHARDRMLDALAARLA